LRSYDKDIQADAIMRNESEAFIQLLKAEKCEKPL
jgi:hypothetical protein